MLQKIFKYLKRTTTFTEFKTFFGRCFISCSDTGEEITPSIVSSFFRLCGKIIVFPIKAIIFSVKCAKYILFMPNFTSSNEDGIEKYLIYRQYARYKMIIFIFFIIISIGFIFNKKISYYNVHGKTYIARISITGDIDDSKNGYGSVEYYENVIKKVIEDKNAVAVIVYINSGGGGVVASETLYKNIRKIAEKKPVFCSVGTVAASGAYMTTLGCRKIYTQEMSIIGSIGVRRDGYEIVDLAKKIGIKFNTMSTGKMKEAGSHYKEMSAEEEAYISDTIGKMHMFFVKTVVEARKMDQNKVLEIADGRIFNGIEAKELKLTDEIGDIDRVLEDLKSGYNFDKDIKIVNFEIPEEDNYSLKLRNFISVAIDGIFASISKNLISNTALVPLSYNY